MTGPKRFSGWKIAGIILAVLVFSIAITVVSLWLGMNRRFDLAQQRIRELEVLPDSRGSIRPVLYGSARPGDGGQEYGFAEAVMLGSGLHHKFRDGPESLSPAEFAVVERGHPVLCRSVQSMKRGARCGSVSIPNERNSDTSQSVCTLGLVYVRYLIASGQSREAAETLLDLCQYGRDKAEARVFLGRILLKWTFAELRALMLSESFDQESLRVLSAGLEVLDGTFPSIDHDHLGVARKWAAEARKVAGKGVVYDLLHRDMETTYCDLSLRAMGASSGDWLHERAALRSLDLEPGGSWNPMVRESTLGLEIGGAYHRYLRAQLRLLRTAAHYLAGDGMLDLDDPFGGKLNRSTNGDGLTLWSIGQDAVDDGGTGDWEFKGRDVVLELKRR